MSFVSNNSITAWDVLGWFGDGDDIWKGHGQFSTPNGIPSSKDPDFDYTAEDHGKNHPYPENKDQLTNGEYNPAAHFQDMDRSEGQVKGAIEKCDREAFSRAMHRLQDYYSHYKKGYRWRPGDTSLPSWGYGHALDGTEPDMDNKAWAEAEKKTREWDDKWNQHCIKCEDKWVVRKK
jgi:hypothetical protein